MKISTKGRYVLRMLVDLAENQGDGYIPLKEISARQGISKKYLEQIILLFNKTDMLRVNRGSQGGYRLARTPDQYTVGEILRLTEGSLDPVDCVGQDPAECERCASCATYPVWKGLARVINDYVDSITLQDIIDQHREISIDNYVI